MAKDVQTQEYDATQPQNRARSIVRDCQACWQSWHNAVDPQSRGEWSQIYRVHLEELFQFLERDLVQLVNRWLEKRQRQEGTAVQELAQMIRLEVGDILVLNTFTYIVEKLPNLAVDEGVDIHADLLSLAAHNLDSGS